MVFTSNKVIAIDVLRQTNTDDEEKKWKGMNNDWFNVYILLLFRYE